MTHAASHDVLLELGVVDVLAAHGDGDGLIGQLSAQLQGVLVVLGDGQLRLGEVQRAVARNLNVLGVGNGLESHCDPHGIRPFVRLKRYMQPV